MSTFKTSVNLDTLVDFFKKHNLQIDDLEPIVDGEVSQAYLFASSGELKVLRVNAHSSEGFQKDQFSYEHFSGPKVPIPRIDEIGQLPDGNFYAVSERVSGKTLDKLSDDEFSEVFPSVLQTMDAIHSTQPIGNGFGSIGLDGKGKYNTWHEALKAIQTEDDDDNLASVNFFEADIYEKARAAIKVLYQYCPEDIRQLIHSDFGFANMLISNGQVSGIIDWDGAAYGDPLYDIAWLDFWASAFDWQINISSEIKMHYERLNRIQEHYDERISCYKLIIAANSMSFFAKSNQKEKYEYARNELLKILNHIS